MDSLAGHFVPDCVTKVCCAGQTHLHKVEVKSDLCKCSRKDDMKRDDRGQREWGERKEEMRRAVVRKEEEGK